jgi:hypothetical protein
MEEGFGGKIHYTNYNIKLANLSASTVSRASIYKFLKVSPHHSTLNVSSDMAIISVKYVVRYSSSTLLYVVPSMR